MATFIGSKSGIQCRSHHQKYEAKYKYPHKIIKEEKEKFDLSYYSSIKERSLPETNSQKNEEKLSQDKNS